MIEEEVVVARVEGGQIWVEKARKSACGSCGNPCTSAVVAEHVATRSVQLAVSSSITVRPGDRVVIGVQESAILYGSLGIYLFPLFGLFAGAILGSALLSSLSPVTTDIAAAAGGAIGFAGTLACLKLTPVLSRHVARPVVLRKLS